MTRGNPVHDDVRAIAAATGATFALDVVLHRDQAIVAAFGGDLLPTHAAATATATRRSPTPTSGKPSGNRPRNHPTPRTRRPAADGG